MDTASAATTREKRAGSAGESNVVAPRQRARRRRKERERVREARKARRGRVCQWTLERDREARVERERDAEWNRQLQEWERERLESEEQWRERDKQWREREEQRRERERQWREREAEWERSQRELEIEMQKNDRILKELMKEVQWLLDLFPRVVRRPVIPRTNNLERIEDGSGVGAGDLVFCDEEVEEVEEKEEESPY
ncbi:hypothetical protein BDN70DRAFT_925293 [Pholiota conissans]|uniref:Uncharacterized protein n=1 Tax=Pholiota conissans TaxID=109636 RepID=A0A9P5YPV4_9AGAR|nr:hypothetical protein BDN70DRAFT_925293 [Pholiota conissans]